MTTTAADRATFGFALAHDEGEAFWLTGMLQTVKIAAADTGGRYGLIEVLVPPGLGSPWHVHTDEDEWFYVIKGEFAFEVGDTAFRLKAGDTLFAPRKIAHAWACVSDEPGTLLTGMLTRYSGGAWGLDSTSCRKYSSRSLDRHTWPHPMKRRCSPDSPSIVGEGLPASEIL